MHVRTTAVCIFVEAVAVLSYSATCSICASQVRLDELCFVGDRLLTDVVFGNLHGMLTVHTQPLTLKGDNRPAAVFRFLERKVRTGMGRKRSRHVELKGALVVRMKGRPEVGTADLNYFMWDAVRTYFDDTFFFGLQRT